MDHLTDPAFANTTGRRSSGRFIAVIRNPPVETAAPRTGPRSACHPLQCGQATRDAPDAARIAETAPPPAPRPPAPDPPASRHCRESKRLASSPRHHSLTPFELRIDGPPEPPEPDHPRALRVDSWPNSSTLLPTSGDDTRSPGHLRGRHTARAPVTTAEYRQNADPPSKRVRKAP